MRRFLAACAMAALAGTVHAADRLGVGNYVETADRLADLLTTSGLAFSTLVIGLSSDPGHPAGMRLANVPRTPPGQSTHVDESQCSGGGSVKTSMLDGDGDGALSAADRFVTHFERCVVDGGVVSGRSEFVVKAHRFEGSVEVTELDFRFHDLGTPELRWSGPARLTLRTDLIRGTERFVVHYDDLAVTRHQQPMRWSFRLDVVRPPIGEQVARLDGPITLGTMRLQLKQEEPFVIAPNGLPRSGLITATDRRGARLQLEAGRWRYAYRYFATGNGSERPDSTSHSRPHGRP